MMFACHRPVPDLSRSLRVTGESDLDELRDLG